MNKTKPIIALVVLIAVASAGAWFFYKDKTAEVGQEESIEQVKGVYPNSKKISYQVILKNDLGRDREKAQFYIYAPVKQTAWQYVRKLNINRPHRVSRDGVGNQLIIFEFHNVKDGAEIKIDISAQMDMASEPNIVDDIEQQSFLMAEQFIEKDDKKIKRLAAKLAKKNKLKTAKAIVAWVSANIAIEDASKKKMEAPMEIPEPGSEQPERAGALKVLKKKTGSVLDIAYLVTALCRANDIPARAVLGVRNGKVDKDALSVWVETVYDNKWIALDINEGKLVSDPEDYVALRILSPAPNLFSETLSNLFYESVGLAASI